MPPEPRSWLGLGPGVPGGGVGWGGVSVLGQAHLGEGGVSVLSQAHLGMDGGGQGPGPHTPGGGGGTGAENSKKKEASKALSVPAPPHTPQPGTHPLAGV